MCTNFCCHHIYVFGYAIDDCNISGLNSLLNNKDGSTSNEFYGDSNGKEYHFVTSNGHVFTLPGFPVTLDDGTVQYHISSETGAYYTVKGSSDLNVGDKNIVGDIVNEAIPIRAEFLADIGPWGLNVLGDSICCYYYNPEASNFGSPRRYTSIGDPEQWTDNGEDEQGDSSDPDNTTSTSTSSTQIKYGWQKGAHYGWYKNGKAEERLGDTENNETNENVTGNENGNGNGNGKGNGKGNN